MMSGNDDPSAATAPGDGVASFGPLLPGAQIGKYEILGTLGVGGFGITYRARYAQGPHEVALKEFLPAALARRLGGEGVVPFSPLTEEVFRWGRAQFLDEARALARLEDVPGVVNVLDFFEANGTAYMAMTLVGGESLEQVLRRDPRPAPATLDLILGPLLVGLEFVHDLRLVHGDITPANILIDESGQPTLIDFGGTRAGLQDRIQAMTSAYTPGYAAPEVAAAEPRGPWTDIYGLSATLYHVVTGHAPPTAMQRASGDDRARAVDAGDDRYSRDLLRAIDAGLALKASQRPQSITEWRRLMDGDGAPHEEALAVPSMPATGELATSGGVPAAQPGRLTWRRVAIAMVVVLAACAALIWRPPVTESPEERLRRAEAEAQRQVAIATKMRQDLEARKQGASGGGNRTATPASDAQAAEMRARAEEDARRRAAEEKARAEAAAREREATETRLRAEEETKRRAAEEKARAEAAAREREAAEARARAEEDAKRRTAEEKARAEAAARDREAAEARARAEEDAKRRTAEEKARTDAAAREREAAEARARAEEDARRRAAEERARAEAVAREREAAAMQARSEEEARRRETEEQARAARERQAAEEQARAEAAAREKEEAAARALAEADAKRRAAEDRAKSQADLRQQAEAAETALRLSEADRQRVQVALNALGHNIGSTAGVFGPRTRAMIAAWQKAQGWPETGFLTAAQHEVLQQQAASALAKRDEGQRKAGADVRPEAAEAALQLSEADRKRVQVALTALGHEVGATTGFIGPRTRAMISAW
ncbi:MAG TPA: serine/threonine-protein kinase, partial [Vineibacter sp.]|nr:serine/threonine-protein kinase [Vineibacter sp.]